MRYRIIGFITIAILTVSLLRAEDDWKRYSAMDSLAICEINVEELQFYQADFFPFYLAEKGRQSAPSWRGMPPGFVDVEYDGISLYNPLWGYWDNQHLPVENIRQRELDYSQLIYQIRPPKIKTSLKPISRIAFSQDFQFGLSYLDANLIRFYRPKSFFQLGGNNFLWTGSADPYSKSHVNSYRGQIHHQFSSDLSIDIRYWQIRHKFTLSPFPVIFLPRKIHRIGQVLSVSMNFQPDSTQKIVLTPYGYKWGDRYHTLDYSEQRKTELYSLGSKAEYQRKIGMFGFGVSTDLVRHEITKAFVFRKDHQESGKVRGYLQLMGKSWNWRLGGGYWFMPGVGNSPELHLSWNIQLPWHIQSTLSLTQVPQTLPLSSLFWNGDSIMPLIDPRLPVRHGINWELEFLTVKDFWFSMSPYYYQFKNTWLYQSHNSRFIQKNIENSGILIRSRTHLWMMRIENELSYNSNYQQSYIPEFKNVLKVNLPFSLFDGALKLENYVIYQFIGKWRKLDYDPLTNQYLRTGTEISNIHLVDIKILGHIKTATLFLVWENLLSEDFAWIDDYTELYRQFRLGIYWTLFD